MKFLTIINLFINGATHEFNDTHAFPMVDEDMAMAFDAAEVYATANPECTCEEAHTAGHAYVSAYTTPARHAPTPCNDFMALAEYAAPHNHRTYLAEYEEQENGCINLTVLDTYSQGITIGLRPDGTYTQYPTGG